MTYFDVIKNDAISMSIDLDDSTVQKLVDYLHLFQKWNKAYNLTSIRDVDQMITLHLIDSISTIPYINGNNIIDVGTGPGLPGMVLAICLPDKQFTLLDSNGKKTRFLTQVKMELSINNVIIANERVEKHAFQGAYDHVISRAFASLEDMIKWTFPLPSENGNFLAMKGIYPDQEIAALPDSVSVEEIYNLSVTNINAERHLVVMKRKGLN